MLAQNALTIMQSYRCMGVELGFLAGLKLWLRSRPTISGLLTAMCNSPPPGVLPEARQYALSVDDLTVAYQEKPAIWDIDLEVPEGVLMGIVGRMAPAKALDQAVLNLIPRRPAPLAFMASR